MATAFQKNAFQNNAFQIIGGTDLKDTHDGLPRKFYLPIYERTKKKPKSEIHKKPELELVDKEILVESAQPLKPAKWDNSAIEAHAKATSQSIAQVEKKIALLQAYERELDEEEEEFFMLAVKALS